MMRLQQDVDMQLQEAWQMRLSTVSMNCIRIKNNPLIGTIEETFADRDKEYRSLIEGHHKLIYTQEGKRSIRIVLWWDCRQNPDKLRTSIR